MVQISDFIAVAASNSLSAALRSDGTVVAWGAFGTEGRAFVPDGLVDVKAIAVGGYHCVAVKRDGTVVAWGVDERGRLDVPAGLRGVEVVAAGFDHSLALKDDGTVVAWGDNSDGGCDVPRGLGDVVDVAIAVGHSVAIKRDGSVVAWGKNGQTLEGGERLSDVLAVSGHSAVKRDGTVVTLGGEGSNTYNGMLVEAPPGLSRVVAVAGDRRARFGLLDDGRIVAWGLVDDDAVVLPDDLGGVAAIAAGDDHVLVLKNDGTVVALGRNFWGQTDVPSLEQLAVGPKDVKREFPGAVQPAVASARFVSVAAGTEHSLALRSDGTVVTWGSNSRGQLDIPTGLRGVVAIDAGAMHSVALLSDGTVATWGGTIGGPVDEPDGLNNVIAIAAAGMSNLALRSDGSVVMWHQAFDKPRDLPTDWTDIVAIGLGPWDPIALRRDGRVLVRESWIGLKPAPSWLQGVSAVAADAARYAYALQSDGTLVRWGDDDPMAALTYANGRAVPFPSATGVIALSAGWNHALALKEDGSVLGWGHNDDQKATVPKGLGPAVAVAAGTNHSLAVTSDGAVVGWGSNKDGQLEVPAAGANGTDSSASRTVLELALRTRKASGGARTFKFSLADPASSQEPQWFLGHRTEGLDVEASPQFPELADGFYVPLAFGLMESVLPSFKWEGDVTSSTNDSTDEEFPIVVRGRISVRREDLANFHASYEGRNRSPLR